MNGVRIAVIMILAAVFSIGIASAMQHEASVDKGKALFNDPKLGTTGKTCNTCHPDGKGLEKSGAMDDLDKTISACIRVSLKGKTLDVKSMEVQSLALYIKSLGEKKPPATKKPAVGC